MKTTWNNSLQGVLRL